jgi:hypothetical protein
LARLGYTIPATLGSGLTNFLWAEAMTSPEDAALIDSFLGHPLETMVEQWRVALPFFLDLGDEALALAHIVA